MELFASLLARHGEVGVQAWLENWERFAGEHPAERATLEQRWAVFMEKTNTAQAGLSFAA